MLLEYLPPILPIFLGVWLAFFLAARFQTNRIKKATTELVLSMIEPALEDHPHLTVEEYYNQILPVWNETVPGKALFMLHKLELWPIPATPQRVKKRINFTPAWVGAYLKIHGHILPASQELKKEISNILQLVPQNPNTESGRAAIAEARKPEIPDSSNDE